MTGWKGSGKSLGCPATPAGRFAQNEAGLGPCSSGGDKPRNVGGGQQEGSRFPSLRVWGDLHLGDGFSGPGPPRTPQTGWLLSPPTQQRAF